MRRCRFRDTGSGFKPGRRANVPEMPLSAITALQNTTRFLHPESALIFTPSIVEGPFHPSILAGSETTVIIFMFTHMCQPSVYRRRINAPLDWCKLQLHYCVNLCQEVLLLRCKPTSPHTWFCLGSAWAVIVSSVRTRCEAHTSGPATNPRSVPLSWQWPPGELRPLPT
jgi:hypothetical protein